MYCKPEFTEDTLEGFRIFVVRFMIIMSKVRVTGVLYMNDEVILDILANESLNTLNK